MRLEDDRLALPVTGEVIRLQEILQHTAEVAQEVEEKVRAVLRGDPPHPLRPPASQPSTAGSAS